MNEVQAMRSAKCCHLGVLLTLEDFKREPGLLNVAMYVEANHVSNLKTKEYIKKKKTPYMIKKKKNDDPCLFLSEGKCLIYETRPQICRDYRCQGANSE